MVADRYTDAVVWEGRGYLLNAVTCRECGAMVMVAASGAGDTQLHDLWHDSQTFGLLETHTGYSVGATWAVPWWGWLLVGVAVGIALAVPW